VCAFVGLITIYVIHMKISYLFKQESSSGDEGSTGYTLGFCREPEGEKHLLLNI
jgi:hypothetical protein